MPRTNPKSGGSTLVGVKKKAPRDHVPRNPNAPVLSGALGGELTKHAYERARHFFLYLITIKLIEYVHNLKSTNKVSAIDGLEVKATDQIDTGFKNDDEPLYNVFDNDDEDMVDQPTTAFSQLDAAHFCNLGIKSTFAASIDLKQPIILSLYEQLKVIAGNTRWLPKRINIGPDRRIDVFHGKFATEILKSGNPPYSRDRVVEYGKRATEEILGYVVQQKKVKKLGVAACASCYLTCYAATNFVDRIDSQMTGELAGWCKSHNLPDARKAVEV